MTLPRNLFAGQPQQVPSPAPLITFAGSSGAKYTFRYYKLGQTFKALPGVYVLCKESTPSVFEVLYVGETRDLNNRVGANFIDHHKWADAFDAGITHVCVRVVSSGKSDRLAMETDLRQFYDPPLNDQ